MSLKVAFFLSAATRILGFSAPDRRILVFACNDRSDLRRSVTIASWRVSIALRQNLVMVRPIAIVDARIFGDRDRRCE